MLLPVESRTEKRMTESRITYILDRDLIRFTKLAGAESRHISRGRRISFSASSSTRLSKKCGKPSKASTRLRKVWRWRGRISRLPKLTVTNLEQDVEQVLAEAKASLGEISARRSEAIALVVWMRALSPQDAAALESAKDQEPASLVLNRKERNCRAVGSTIRIRFMDGDQAKHENVKSIVQRSWTKYANINSNSAIHLTQRCASRSPRRDSVLPRNRCTGGASGPANHQFCLG